jgi:mediator of RNA polymerase II transcription subunit 12, fungi type
MDQPTMIRIFDTLTKRLGIGNIDGNICPNETAKYLGQLRTFNTKYFDALMIRWVISVLKMAPQTGLPKILVPLIGVGCVTFQGFFALIKKLLNSNSDKAAIPDMAGLHLDMLQLLGPDALDENVPLDYVRLNEMLFQ